MKRTSLARAVAVVSVAAMSAGCIGEAPTAEDLAEELASIDSAVLAKGRICAAGEDGPTTCVASGGDVGSVYNASAWNCGSDGRSQCSGIEVWPDFPEGMKFSDGIRNKAAVKQLLGDVDLVVAFASTLSAYESHTILAGKLSDVLRRVRNAQTRALSKPAWQLNEPAEAFYRTMITVASKSIDPLAMEQVRLKQQVPAIQTIFTWAQRRLKTPAEQYAGLVQRYQSFQTGEAKVADDLTDLANRASQSDLVALAALSAEVADYADQAGTEADNLALDAARLRATLAQIEEDYRSRIDEHHAVLEERLGAIPDLTSTAQRSLSNMVAYCQSRRSQTDSALSSIMQGMRLRRDALIAQAVDAETQQTLRDGAFLRASTEFLSQANEWRAKIGQSPPRTTKYRFYIFTATYDDYMALLALEPLCSTEQDAERPTWRDAGCNAFERSFGIAHTTVEVSIPQIVRIAISQLRSKGVDEAALTNISSLLDQGSIRQAVVAYDAAALSTENK